MIIIIIRRIEKSLKLKHSTTFEKQKQKKKTKKKLYNKCLESRNTKMKMHYKI